MVLYVSLWSILQAWLGIQRARNCRKGDSAWQGFHARIDHAEVDASWDLNLAYIAVRCLFSCPVHWPQTHAFRMYLGWCRPIQFKSQSGDIETLSQNRIDQAYKANFIDNCPTGWNDSFYSRALHWSFSQKMEWVAILTSLAIIAHPLFCDWSDF